MDYLLELSTAAKEEAQVASTDKLGFDTIASFLDLSLESAGSSEILEQSSDELSILEESQTEVCKNMALTNDIDSMLDEALHRYSLSNNFNTKYVCDSGHQYVSAINTFNVAFPELINATSNANTSLPMQHTEKSVQTLKGPHGDYKASLYQGILSPDIKRPDAGTRYNSASELTKTPELRKIGTDLNTTPNKVSDSENCLNRVSQPASEISEKIASGNSSVQRINQQGIQPAFTPAHVPSNGSLMNGPLLPKPPLLPQPVWNTMASPFYPDLKYLLQQNPAGLTLSTDDYFYKNGQYLYDANCIVEAHQWAHKQAKDAFEKSISPIIIDNTNVQGRKMKPYGDMAIKNEYKATFREPDPWWKFKTKELERKNNIMPPTLEREEPSFCSTDKTGKESIFDTVAGGTSQSRFTNTSQSGCTSNISKSCVETLPEVQKESMTKNERKNDFDAADEQNSLIPSGEDTHNSDHVKAHDENSLFSIKGSFEEETVIEQDISNVDGASLLLCERPELLNFVVDWPVEQTMGQMAQWNRRVKKNRSSLMKDGEMNEPSSQQLSEIIKIADSGPKQSENGTVANEVLFQAQYNHMDNPASLQSECEIDIYTTGPCSETYMSEMIDLDGEDEISDGLIGDPQEITEIIADMQKMEISNDKEVETLTCDTTMVKMPRQSKRYCRQSKLALTFTNSSLKTEQSSSTCQSQETIRQTIVGTSKCSQTEPQEFALVWRIEKKKIDISDSIKVLTGKIDRFKAKSLDVNLVSESQDKIPYRVMHDQSTSVEENELISLDDEDSLNILSKLCRSVSFDVLKDLFERCNKDIVWATNLLLDSGENFHSDEDCEPEKLYGSGEATPAMLGCSNSDELGTSDQTSKLHLYDSSLPICEHTDISWDDETEDLDNSHTVVHTISPFVTEESRNVNDSSNIDVKNTKTNKLSGMAKNTNSLDPKKKKTAVETLSVDMIPCSELKRETIFRIPDFITAASSNALVEQNTNCMEVHDQQLQLSDPKEGQQEPDIYNEIPLVETLDGNNIDPEEDKAKQTNSGSLSKESLRFEHLELSLPPELAFQLSELFGPVGIDPGSLTIEDCVVRIDLNLAKAIHKRWKESITERHNASCLSYQLLFEDSSSHEHVQLDNMIQSEESKLAGSIGALDQSQGASDMLLFMDQWNTPTRKVPLRQIMSEEIALQERENLKRRKDCAAKLKSYLYWQKMKASNHRAAMQIFQRVNEFLLPENILDLHGLHVDEAMKHFRQVLQDKSEEFKQSGGKSYLSVITGRGNHSQGGVARIKPAVIDYLTNHDFRFVEIKPGVLRVTLK
ncbi:NEDD4-binding protein 2-like isoform X3 [Ascaphus truei]|uniref:NEDD4-binding protein 2-like isoform X3 n=1 Tax=Ascaphus truei TaxID=8439 RepID=UPI003F59BD9A